jgi:hypothetical protein
VTLDWGLKVEEKVLISFCWKCFSNMPEPSPVICLLKQKAALDCAPNTSDVIVDCPEFVIKTVTHAAGQMKLGLVLEIDSYVNPTDAIVA